MPNVYTKRNLNIRDLQIADQIYQRGVKTIASLIAKNFDPNACLAIIVGIRKDGSMWIVDGHQRTTAAALAGYTTIWAETFESKGPKDEAKRFEQINGQRMKVSTSDLFRSALVAKYSYALAIQKIVNNSGFSLYFKSSGGEWNDISCFAIISKLYLSKNKNNLAEILEIIASAWPEMNNACHETLVKGLNYCVNELKRADIFDKDRFIAKMSKKTPNQILIGGSDIRARRNIGSGSTRYAATAEYIAKIYRSRSKTNVCNS